MTAWEGARPYAETYQEQVDQAREAVAAAVRDADAQATAVREWVTGGFREDPAAHPPGQGQAPDL